MADSNRELVDSLEREWRDALCAHDVERLRALLHPRFTLIGSAATGAFVLTRDQWLAAVEKRELIGIEIEVKDAAVFEQVIIGTIQTKWRVSYLGKAIEDSVLLTDVWVFDEGRWRVIRRHSTPIPVTGSDFS